MNAVTERGIELVAVIELDGSSGGGGARVFSPLNDQEKKGGERKKRGEEGEAIRSPTLKLRCGAVAIPATRALHSRVRHLLVRAAVELSLSFRLLICFFNLSVILIMHRDKLSMNVNEQAINELYICIL